MVLLGTSGKEEESCLENHPEVGFVMGSKHSTVGMSLDPSTTCGQVNQTADYQAKLETLKRVVSLSIK